MILRTFTINLHALSCNNKTRQIKTDILLLAHFLCSLLLYLPIIVALKISSPEKPGLTERSQLSDDDENNNISGSYSRYIKQYLRAP